MGAIKGTKKRIEAMLAVGELSASDIARQVGCSRKNVANLAKKARSSLLENCSEFWIPVPAWAEELRDDYRDHARLFGEHEAARHCRRLLAEARAAERMAA